MSERAQCRRLNRVFAARDDALGEEKAGHQVVVVARRPHRHRQRRLFSRVRVTMLQKYLEWLFNSDEVARLLYAATRDAFDFSGGDGAAGHNPASLVDPGDDSPANSFAVARPIRAVFLRAEIVVAAFAMDQQNREIDRVEVGERGVEKAG